MIEAFIFVVFPFCMVYAAVSDLLSMTISNRVPVILAAAFVVAAALTGMPSTTILLHGAVALGVLAFGFAMFSIRAMGGGDAKLMAASAIWFGPNLDVVGYLLNSVLLGGVLTLALLSFRASPLATFAGSNSFLRHLANDKSGIPYGIALGVGGLLSYPDSPLARWALERLTSL